MDMFQTLEFGQQVWRLVGGLMVVFLSTMAESLSTSAIFSLMPDSYLTAVSQTVAGVTGDIMCGHMCMTAVHYTCLAYT